MACFGGGSGWMDCGSGVDIMALERRRTMKRRFKAAVERDLSISRRVRAVMKSLGWEQKDLARKLDLSEGYMSRVMSGRRSWPVFMVFDAAEALGVPVSDIDPDIDPELREAVMRMALRRDVPHLPALYTFIETLPKIIDAKDLHALIRVMKAFAEKDGSG